MPRSRRPPNGNQLPPAPVNRWTPQRKALLLLAVTTGEISVEEACSRYDLTEPELAAWLALFDEFGPAGLRSTRVQMLRGRKRRRRGYPARRPGKG